MGVLNIKVEVLNEDSKKIMVYVLSICIAFIVIYSVVDYLRKQSEYHESKYELEEIENGIYARTYHTVSTIPAHNYDVIEICIKGKVCTYKGTVNITYTSENPYVVIMQNNFVNDDKVFAYVPKDTIDYRESVGVK